MVIDYNFAIVLITLIILYIELKENYKQSNILRFNLKKDLLIGVLLGLAIATKQTLGIVLALAAIGYKIIEVSNKKEFMEFLKIASIRALGTLIPVIILLGYLLINNAFNDFINYTILGIKEFDNNIPYIELFRVDDQIHKILSIAIIPTILITFLIGVIKRDKKALIISVYSVTNFAVLYPISNVPHLICGSLVGIIGFVYIIKCIIDLIKFEKLKKYALLIIKIIIIIAIIVYLGKSTYNIAKYIKDIPTYSVFNHFKYIPVEPGIKNMINSLTEYILAQEKEVYIVDADAAIYNVAMDVYHKDYNLLLKGNLGLNGEERIIKDLESKTDALIIIKKAKYNWQLPMEIIDYIKQNFTKVDEITVFDVYETK